MHVTILSRGESVHSTRRLVEAAKRLGHRTRVLDPLSLQLGMGDAGAVLFHNEKPISRTDVVIPRIAQSINTFGLAVVNHYDIAGTALLNDAQSIAQARNKMRLMQQLANHGVPVPATMIGRGANELRRMVDHVGGFPVAVKIVEGPEKSGVIVCETAQSMEATLEAVLSMGHNIMVQRYVKPSEGRDLRALVVGNEVLATVRRHGTGGKLRHTLGAGKGPTAARLTIGQRQLALDAAHVVGLEVAAVDLLETKRAGTCVFDVHSSPGLRDLEAATGEDLAAPVIERAIALARQRRALAALNGGSRPRRPSASSRA